MRIPLFNLDVGEKHPGERFGKVKVGPFTVKLVDNYAEQVAKIPQHGGRKDSFDSETGRSTSFYEASGHGWHVTAVAELDEDAGESSVFSDPAAADGGVWDLCGLLTFLTGRRVATEKGVDRFSPRPSGSHACIPLATLATAAAAWPRRKAIADRDLGTALFLYNEGTGHDVLQVFSSLYNTALNAILDSWDLPLKNVAAEKRQALRRKVVAVVECSKELSPEERAGFEARLGATVDQGLLGQADKLPALLVDLGIIQARGTAGQDDEVVFRRVKYVNTVRNLLTHAGKIPRLKGLDEEQAKRHAIAITSGVVPCIFKLAIGHLLALDPKEATGFKLLIAIREELTVFFSRGVWRDWPLEEKSFDEWFYAERQAPW